jgi:hypothetical protein
MAEGILYASFIKSILILPQKNANNLILPPLSRTETEITDMLHKRLQIRTATNLKLTSNLANRVLQ